MQFLLKVVQSDETESSLEDSQREEEVDGQGDAEVTVQVDRNVGSRSETTTGNTAKKLRLQEEVDNKILKALENPPDEDEAFFISITPSVRLPALWDKSASDYSNKDARQRAWVNVGESMYPEWPKFSYSER
ncbi:hypothetical protein FQR65_LT17841 [Abscondita terminalis]|nr:hypothetical protein FQR65_LT17841 [Abscondita terminalis]